MTTYTYPQKKQLRILILFYTFAASNISIERRNNAIFTNKSDLIVWFKINKGPVAQLDRAAAF